ncbi:sigma factor regulator N-terminal domain-containing protein, partial [Bacillus altitudinis]|uniref:sigma factor regulator N-terminal domain-containing protein n=1 Tax=Bacillus altitudinis TaxID=293387 RepID=UPI001643ED5B
YRKRKSYLPISLLPLVSTFIILPLCTLRTYLYYRLPPPHTKPNHFMQTPPLTLPLTKPNLPIHINHLKRQLKLFPINTQLNLQKQIPNKTEPIPSQQIQIFFHKLNQPTI